ncbi:hypothetical protein Poly30_13980 [Planctomycetes bacterium Poly30]|uniref:Uncharacterized protein n=1 Tax=Saltatorellus ferox TaxID=2528018 RepID=A0A518EP86_9BACT|nr:hypothetical protein Poly30_13980 [Planctomycetes bacterium Poly30]
MFEINAWAAIGFVLAAYAVVGNDALQTLGTFITSNGRLHWSVLFGFAALILVATFTYGYCQSYGELVDASGQVLSGVGDPSFGRLDNVKKYPVFDVQWYHTVPALGLLILTRFGVPVSTSFMVLAVFASIEGLTSMIKKSLLGYGLAFALGLGLYLILAKTVEKHFSANGHAQNRKRWVLLQWTSTTWLWSVWLMQDFANIFVFLPRQLQPMEAIAGLAVILVLLAITFANRGGPVQKVLKSKTSVTDIRSATIIDFLFAGLLYYFKERSKIPMSTTWVFLGLIAGREYAFAMMGRKTTLLNVSRIALSDLAKATIGLVVSIDMARGLPWIAEGLEGGAGAFALVSLHGGNSSTLAFLVASNALLIPCGLFLMRPSRMQTWVLAGSMATAAVAFLGIAIR